MIDNEKDDYQVIEGFIPDSRYRGVDIFTGEESSGFPGDIAITLGKGALAAGGAIASGLDMVTGGSAATEATEHWLNEASAALNKKYSPETQLAQQERSAAIDAADGEFDKGATAVAQTLWHNPRLLVTDFGETLPSMAIPILGASKVASIGGKAIRNRLLQKATAGTAKDAVEGASVSATRMAKIDQITNKAQQNIARRAAYAGEGAIGGGAATQQIIADNLAEGRDPTTGVWAGSAVAAATAGVAAGMGKLLPGAAGLEGAIAGGPRAMAALGKQVTAKSGQPQSLLGRMVSPAGRGLKSAGKTFLGEGTEEAIQGVFETAVPNYALDKPITEGMGENVGQSFALGGAMGVGMHGMTLPFRRGQQVVDQRPTIDAPRQVAVNQTAADTPLNGQPIPVAQPAGMPEGQVPQQAMDPAQAGVAPTEQPVQQPQTYDPNDNSPDAMTARTEERMRQEQEARDRAAQQAAEEKAKAKAEREQAIQTRKDERKQARQRRFDARQERQRIRAEAQQKREAERQAKAEQVEQLKQERADLEQARADVDKAFPRSTARPKLGRTTGRTISTKSRDAYNAAPMKDKGVVASAMDEAYEETRLPNGRARMASTNALVDDVVATTSTSKSLKGVKRDYEARAKAGITSADPVKRQQATLYKYAAVRLAKPLATKKEIKAEVAEWEQSYADAAAEKQAKIQARIDAAKAKAETKRLAAREKAAQQREKDRAAKKARAEKDRAAAKAVRDKVKADKQAAKEKAAADLATSRSEVDKAFPRSTAIPETGKATGRSVTKRTRDAYAKSKFKEKARVSSAMDEAFEETRQANGRARMNSTEMVVDRTVAAMEGKKSVSSIQKDMEKRADEWAQSKDGERRKQSTLYKWAAVRLAKPDAPISEVRAEVEQWESKYAKPVKEKAAAKAEKLAHNKRVKEKFGFSDYPSKEVADAWVLREQRDGEVLANDVVRAVQEAMRTADPKKGDKGSLVSSRVFKKAEAILDFYNKYVTSAGEKTGLGGDAVKPIGEWLATTEDKGTIGKTGELTVEELGEISAVLKGERSNAAEIVDTEEDSEAGAHGEMFAPSFEPNPRVRFGGRIYEDRYSAPEEAEGSPTPKGFSNREKVLWSDITAYTKKTRKSAFTPQGKVTAAALQYVAKQRAKQRLTLADLVAIAKWTGVSVDKYLGDLAARNPKYAERINTERETLLNEDARKEREKRKAEAKKELARIRADYNETLEKRRNELIKELGRIRQQEAEEAALADALRDDPLNYTDSDGAAKKLKALEVLDENEVNDSTNKSHTHGPHMQAFVMKPASSRRANVVNIALLDIIGRAASEAGVALPNHRVYVLKADGEPKYNKDGTKETRLAIDVPDDLYKLIKEANEKEGKNKGKVIERFTVNRLKQQQYMLEVVVDQILGFMRDHPSGREWIQDGSDLLGNILTSYAHVMRAAGVKYEKTRLGRLLNYLVSIEQTERAKSKQRAEKDNEEALLEAKIEAAENKQGSGEDTSEAEGTAELTDPRAREEEAFGRRVKAKVRRILRQFKPAKDPDGSKGSQARSEFFFKTDALTAKDALLTPVARFRERVLAKDENELAPEVWTKEQQTASKETNRGFFQKLTDHGLKYNSKELTTMHAFTKNEVKNLFGKEGKRKAYTGTFEPAHADVLAETLVKTTFFPTILKPGESRGWAQRIKSTAGEFQKDQLGDVIGYRAIIPNPLGNETSPMNVVEHVLKMDIDREYARFKNKFGGRVEDLKIQQNAIKDAAGMAMVRSPKVFSHAFRVGLGKIIYGVADTRTAWTAMENFESRVHDVLNQLNIKEKDRAKLDALMRENMDLAKAKLGVTEAMEKAFAQPQGRFGPTASEDDGSMRRIDKIRWEKDLKGGTFHSPEFQSRPYKISPEQATRIIEAQVNNAPNKQVTHAKVVEQVKAAEVSSKVKAATVFIPGAKGGVAVTSEAAAQAVRDGNYSPKGLLGVFSESTAKVWAAAVKKFDELGWTLPKNVLICDGLQRDSHTTFGKSMYQTVNPRKCVGMNGKTEQRSVGVVNLRPQLPEDFPQDLMDKAGEGMAEDVRRFAEQAAFHELIHAKIDETGTVLTDPIGRDFTSDTTFAVEVNEMAQSAALDVKNGVYSETRHFGNILAHAIEAYETWKNAGRSEEECRNAFGNEFIASCLPDFMDPNSGFREFLLENGYNEIYKTLEGVEHVLKSSTLFGHGTASGRGVSQHAGNERGADGLSKSEGENSLLAAERNDGVGEGSVRSGEQTGTVEDTAKPNQRTSAGESTQENVPAETHEAGGVTDSVSGNGTGARAVTDGSASTGRAKGEDSGRGDRGSSTQTSGMRLERSSGGSALPPAGNRGSSGGSEASSRVEATAKDQILARVPERLKPLAKTVADLTKNGSLRFMFTRNFVESFKHLLPSMETWWKNVERLMQERSQLQQKAADIAERFSKLSKYEQEKVNGLLLEATMSEFWAYRDNRVFPTQQSWNDYLARVVKADKEGYSKFLKKYHSLSSAAKASMQEVLNNGTDEKLKITEIKLRDAHNTILKQLQGASPQQKAELEAQYAQEAKEIKRDLARALEHPYVPLGRHGNHVVTYRSEAYLNAQRAVEQYRAMLNRVGGKPTKVQEQTLQALQEKLDDLAANENDYVVEFYESLYDANKRYYELQKKFPGAPAEGLQVFDKAKYLGDNAPKWMQSRALLQQLTKEMEAESGTGSIKEADLRRMSAVLQEMFVKALPSGSARKADLKRRGVAGYNENMMENFVRHAQASSHMIASMNHSQAIHDSLEAIGKEARGQASNGKRDEAAIVANEVRRRQGQIFGGQQNGKMAGNVMRSTSLWMLLTNPAFYLQNLLQPAMMSAPYINGALKVNCLPELMRTMKSVAQLVKDDKTLRSLQTKVSSDEYAALMQARDRQLLTIGITSDLGEVGADSALGKATNWLTKQAQTVETINRVATHLVAFRLAKQKGMSNEEAQAFAERTIEQTHGDYSRENAPSFFNMNDMTRTATQFRKFQFIQAGMVFRLMRDAARKDLSPEERAIARRQFVWTLATHFAMAGLKGTPVIAQAMAISAMIFGGGGDDDDDMIRRAVKDKGMSDFLLVGMPSLLGLDLSKKVGAGDMTNPLPFFEFDVTKGKRNAFELMANLAGPWASVGGRAAEGLKYLYQGDYTKALENFLPYGLFANGVKAMRLGAEGFTNNSGDVLIKPDGIGLADVIGTAMGVTTSTIGDRSRLQGSMLRHDNYFNERKRLIQREYNEAKATHDYAGMREAIKKLGEMNQERKAAGYATVKAKTLSSGYKQKTTREKQAVGGVTTTKQNRRFINDMARW